MQEQRREKRIRAERSKRYLDPARKSRSSIGCLVSAFSVNVDNYTEEHLKKGWITKPH